MAEENGNDSELDHPAVDPTADALGGLGDYLADLVQGSPGAQVAVRAVYGLPDRVLDLVDLHEFLDPQTSARDRFGIAGEFAGGLLGGAVGGFIGGGIGPISAAVGSVAGSVRGSELGERGGLALYDQGAVAIPRAQQGILSLPGQVNDGAFGLVESLVGPSFQLDPDHCFHGETQILVAGGGTKPIKDVRIGDVVLAFDPTDGGKGPLVGRTVVRLFQNITDSFYKLDDGTLVTPGHWYLSAAGGFVEAAKMVGTGLNAVDGNGREVAVDGLLLSYSEETASLAEQAEGFYPATIGTLALAPVYKKGWKTYNFEVEGFHTYVAGGLRVHNASYFVQSGNTLSQIAVDAGTTVSALLEANPGIKNRDMIYVDQHLEIPDGRSGGSGSAGSSGGYTIRPGDTLSEIAASNNTTVSALMQANPGISDSDEIYAGDTIAVPGGSGSSSPSQTGSSGGGSSSSHLGGGTYTIESGDSLSEIAQANGTTVDALVEANPGIDDPDEIYAGDTLNIAPILLDLNGNGIELTEIGRSNKFVDVDGDGRQHRTAWAGTGDGVLVRDANNDGVINLAHEIDFAQWDASATSDMEALRNAFDTNRNGKLDAGDRDFALFKVMVTNADGSSTLKTLGELGITSIGLISNNQEVRFNDGSAIQGTTTFARSDGTTGTAADAVLAYNAEGFLAQQTSTSNPDGSTTTVVTGLNANGGVGEVVTTVLSSNGLTKTISVDTDGDGITDSVMTETKVIESDGSTTRTNSYHDGSGTLLRRSETTHTSADGKVVTISRDSDGSGTNESSETRTQHADGGLTLTIRGVNPNGSIRAESITTTSANGLSQGILTDLDGDGDVDASLITTTGVAGNGDRIEVATNSSGSGASGPTKVGQTITTYRADGSGKLVIIDRDGDGDVDTTIDDVIQRQADGSSVTTSVVRNGDGSLRSQMQTSLSADGNTETIKRDSDGDGVYEVSTVSATTVDSTGPATRTVTTTAADGTLTKQSVSTWSADGLTRSTEIDTDGDGVVDKIQTIETIDGEPVETVFSYSPDGTVLLTETVRTTSGGGLTSNGVGDTNGDGIVDVLLTGSVVANSDGTATRTDVVRTGDNSEIKRIVTNSSADGLTVTTQEYLAGEASPYRTISASRETNPDGSVELTSTIFAGATAVQTGKIITTTSADKLTEIESRYVGTNLQPSEVIKTVTSASGERTRTVETFSPDGSVLLSAHTSTADANGGHSKTTWDVDANGVVDASTVADMQMNTDGSTISTVTSYAGDATTAAQKTGQLVITSSANGFSTVTREDEDGDGNFDTMVEKATTLNADGSKTTTATTYNGDGSIQTGKVVTEVSDDGLAKSISTYLGDACDPETVSTAKTELGSDGSVVDTGEVYNTDGSLRSSTVTTTSGNGLVKTTSYDFEGDGIVDHKITSTTQSAGGKTVVSETFNESGTLTSRSTETTDSSGLLVTTVTDLDGNGTTDRGQTRQTVASADGSSTVTETDTDASGAVIGRRVITTSSNGMNVTTQIDGAGTGDFTRTNSQTKTVNADGTITETVSNFDAAGALHDKHVRITSADGNSATTTIDLNGDGVTDQTIVQAQANNGTTSSSFMDGPVQSAGGRQYGAGGGRYDTLSSNGLVRTTRLDANGDGLAERQTVATTELRADGSRSTLVVRSDLSGGVASSADPIYTATTTETSTTTTSADGWTTNYAWDLNGDGRDDRSGTSDTTFNPDGSTTETICLFDNGKLSSKTVVTVSSDELTTTTQRDSRGTGTFDEVLTQTTTRSSAGELTVTAVTTNAAGVVLSRTITTVSADGRIETIEKDLDGCDGFEETTRAEVETLADGSTVRNEKTFNSAGVLLSSAVTERSADGRITKISHDSDGDGALNQVRVVTVHEDGSSTTSVSDYKANGTLASTETVSTSWDGLHQTRSSDFDADGDVDESSNFDIVSKADGSREEVLSTFRAGALYEKVRVTTSAEGQVKTETDVNGDGSFDKSSLSKVNIDGSVTTTFTSNATAQAKGEELGYTAWSSESAASNATVAAASTAVLDADGYSGSVSADYDGDGLFEHSRSWVRHLDGSMTVQIVEKRHDGTVMAAGTITVSADGQTSSLSKDIGNNGSIDETQVSELSSDGRIRKTVTTYNSDGTVRGSSTIVIAANGEQELLHTAGAAGNDSLVGTNTSDVLIGAAGADTLSGGAADDILIGGLGADALYGGDGLDIASYENAASFVHVHTGNPSSNAGEAAGDTHHSIEGLRGSAFADELILVTADGRMYGGSGDDVLTFVGSHVQMHGEAGSDSLHAGNGNDDLYGGSEDDVLIGYNGDDFLDGGSGVDWMVGGAGNDTYVVERATDSTVEYAGEGTDTVLSSITLTLAAHVENLVLTGQQAINGTGNSLNNVLSGNASANTLTGGGGNDTLIGGYGADRMVGGTGNDTYYVESAGDIVVEASGEGTDHVHTAIGYTLGSNLEHLTLTGTSAINGTGNTLNNTITGNAAANVLSGGSGNDALSGGGGDDVLIGGLGADAINGGEGLDFASYENATAGVYAHTGQPSSNAGEAAGDTYSSIEGLRGSAFADDLIVTVDNGRIHGGGGDDYLTFVGLNGELHGDIGNDELHAGSGNDRLFGGTGNDDVIAYGGNDHLDGGTGVDWMVGGTGDDTYVVDDAADSVIEAANEGIDNVRAGLTHTLAANVENLVLTGAAAINGTGNGLDNVLTGNTAANVLTGGAGNDMLDGGLGNDTLVGGTGNDTYIVDAVGDVVTEAASQGTDLVRSAITYTLGGNVENLTLTGSSATNGTGNSLNNVLTGNGVANVLTGGAGNDMLDGGEGSDTLVGGTGDDTYIVDSAGDIVNELANEGNDLVKSAVTYALGANLENLTLTGSKAINGTGNAAANTLTGNGSDNLLNGGAGADTMIGGGGNDIYVVDNSGDSVVEAAGCGTDLVRTAASYTLGSNVENLTLTGSAAVNGTGNGLDNVLTGNTAANVLNGGAGNDTLDGGAGNDTLIGGAGDDTYTVDSAGDAVTESASQGTDTVQSSITYSLGSNLENLTLTGGMAINGTGNTLNNVLVGNFAANLLTGGAGNDTLDGNAGNDTLIGGTGDDTYVVDTTGDQVTELAGQGADTVQSTISYVLGSNVENLTLLGTADLTATGNSLANILVGNDGNNVFRGGGGTDTYYGGEGIDTVSFADAAEGISFHRNEHPSTYTGEAYNEYAYSIEVVIGTNFADNMTVIDDCITVYGGGGDDHLNTWGEGGFYYGEAGHDTLWGDNGVDHLDGGNDNDLIEGYGGCDILIGGHGADELYGGDDADRLDGGVGFDWLVGGFGDDTFVFASGSGEDTIADFTVHAGGSSGDVIELQGQTMTTFAAVMAGATEWNGNTYLHLDGGAEVALNGVTMSQLSADDFRFV
ncbi:MAG TPA: LysM peptidoglycan-binding domain-containing protein [Devosia sp.]|uniref:LysM peptidoglycan-binding domain-containing protein n=1 Tax=Devosia sp. TaxID=1871048 RepID=UPI002F94DAEA